MAVVSEGADDEDEGAECTWVGSHFVPVRKEKPKWANAGLAWMTSDDNEHHEEDGEQGGHRTEGAPVGTVGHGQQASEPPLGPGRGDSVARLVTVYEVVRSVVLPSGPVTCSRGRSGPVAGCWREGARSRATVACACPAWVSQSRTCTRVDPVAVVFWSW